MPSLAESGCENGTSPSKEAYNMLIELVKHGLGTIEEMTSKYGFHVSGFAPIYVDSQFYLGLARDLSGRKTLAMEYELNQLEGKLRHIGDAISSSSHGREQIAEA